MFLPKPSLCSILSQSQTKEALEAEGGSSKVMCNRLSPTDWTDKWQEAFGRLEFLTRKWAILKGCHFTAWTDNNPLTYILTKPRLDACEQHWVAKLASFSFDLKYGPSKNIVTDTLSREPFVQSSVNLRLVTETYHSLLNQVNGVVDQVVQDSFQLTTNCQVLSPADGPSYATGVSSQGQMTASPLSSQDVAAILDAHCSGGVGWMIDMESIPHFINVDQTTALNVNTLSAV